MSCFRPLRGYKDETGDVRIGVHPKGRALELPCGRCVGCKMDRARSWSIRITHEAQLYDANWFLTLTYRDELLPEHGSLQYEDYQGFMKRLRFHLKGQSPGPNGKYPIRFFCCGEYGDRLKRPHYHAILFNVDFPDRVRLMNGTFRSELCEEIWQKGDVLIGDVNPRSASYVAGYCWKKQYGQAAKFRYDVMDSSTGEVVGTRRPEFVSMSRRPGVGAWWFREVLA